MDFAKEKAAAPLLIVPTGRSWNQFMFWIIHVSIKITVLIVKMFWLEIAVENLFFILLFSSLTEC